MPTHTTLKSVTSAGESTLSELVEFGLYNFFQWGLLGIGAFVNVTAPASGAYGDTFTRLRAKVVPDYSAGQVWEGARGDWVWETGVEHATQPIRVSGVTVNNTFQPATGVGPYAFTVDYPNGRVIFSASIPTSSVVNCEYSYRLYHVSTAESPGWKQVQFDSFRVDDSQLALLGSGNWGWNAERRLPLPALVLEAVPEVYRRPYEVGHQVATATQVIHAHFLAETKWERNHLHDIITSQWMKHLRGVDRDRLAGSNRFPLLYDGSPNPSGMAYPQMVEPSGAGGFAWKQIRVITSEPGGYGSRPPLHWASVRLMCEVEVP